MIPSTDILLSEDVEFNEEGNSKIYKMNINQLNISGYIDSLASLKQMIYKILNTERYEYLAYSWDFGIYTMDLFGQEMNYVISEIERRITEALTHDERITSCDNFEFTVTKKKKLLVTFTAHTIYGDVDAEKVVNI